MRTRSLLSLSLTACVSLSDPPPARTTAPDLLVRVFPVAPITGDTLGVSVSTALAPQLTWRRSDPPAVVVGPRLDGTLVRRGDTWSVTATDGERQGTAEVTIGDAPPEVVTVWITPALPRQDVLAALDAPPSCHALARDPEGDPITFTYAWTTPRGVVAGQTLGDGDYVAADALACEATAWAQDRASLPKLAHTTVDDRPPSSSATLTLAPTTPRPGHEVRCVTTAWTDPDGSPDVGETLWFVDGVLVGSGAVLPGGAPAAGAQLRCQHAPSDGTYTLDPLEAFGVVAPDVPAPNVLLVIADDVGSAELAAYGLSADVPRTPNVDHLAATGVTFEHAWAMPTCSPTRATIMTGQYAWRTGIGIALQSYDDPFGLTPDRVLLPEVLGPSGYTSAMIGKWHLTTFLDGAGQRILDFGFERYRGSLGNLGQASVPPSLPGTQSFSHYLNSVDATTEWFDGYATTQEADDAITAMVELPEPWLVVLAFHAAHAPYHRPPAELLGSPPPPMGSERGRYKAMIEAMDTELGRVLAAAPQDDTMVVFIGDNGSPVAVASSAIPSGQAKRTLYEGGLGVPLIVAGPHVLAPGTTATALAGSIDLMSTLADVAGLPPPATSEGRSLLPWIVDSSVPDPGSTLYAVRWEDNENPVDVTEAARDARWKLIRTSAGEVELHDLAGRVYESDASALDPLDPANTAIVARLTAVMEAQRSR